MITLILYFAACGAAEGGGGACAVRICRRLLDEQGLHLECFWDVLVLHNVSCRCAL